MCLTTMMTNKVISLEGVLLALPSVIGVVYFLGNSVVKKNKRRGPTEKPIL